MADSVWTRHWEQAVVTRPGQALDPWESPRSDEAVLVLGEAVGEECVRAAADVGPRGRVIGIETADEQLALSRARIPPFAKREGYENLAFHKAKLDDLKLDRERVNAWLQEHPVQRDGELAALEAAIERLRAETPVVADDSIDVVIARGVLGKASAATTRAMFAEIFRVLRRGGRVVLSGVTSDEDVPEQLYAHATLSSAGIRGSVREDELVHALESASFYGIHIAERAEAPRCVVEGIELRDMVVYAYKGKEGPCWECNQAVIYRGPFKSVEDDDGHVLHRGVRIAVCEKTFRILSQQPYRDHVELVQPAIPIAVESAEPFPCADDPIVRDPKAQKGTATAAPAAEAPAAATKTTKSAKAGGSSCAPGSSCC
ncbi:MAG TPA: methyltransferase domain-containing protein [Kofleriaceae bacterium]|nr:methyltransferase domain-containing protein [Kofleriaceae bacterium]